MLPTILVETPSKVPPITPPTSGIILPKLIAPFSPNLVRSLKPTRLLIAVIVSLEMFLINCVDSFEPMTIPVPLRMSFAALPARQE